MCILLHSCINLDQWYQSGQLFLILLFMSPMRSGYKELGLDLVEPLQDQPCKPQRTPMGDEKKDEGAGNPIKICSRRPSKNKGMRWWITLPKSFNGYPPVAHLLCNQLQKEKKRDINALWMSHFEGATSNKLHKWTILGWYNLQNLFSIYRSPWGHNVILVGHNIILADLTIII